MRHIHGTDRYYAQLVCKGLPYVKVDEKGERIHTIGHKTVGLDIAPAAIAIVGDTKAKLGLFVEANVREHH